MAFFEFDIWKLASGVDKFNNVVDVIVIIIKNRTPHTYLDILTRKFMNERNIQVSILMLIHVKSSRAIFKIKSPKKQNLK